MVDITNYLIKSNANNPFSNQPIVDVNAAVWTHIKSKPIRVILYIIFAGISIYATYKTGEGTLLGIAVFVGIFLYTKLYLAAREAFMRQFAENNGYEFMKEGTIPLLEGTAFTRGHSQRMSDVVRGTFAGQIFQLFIFSYTVGHGKRSHTYSSTVFELDFDKPMPHMILTSKSYAGGFSTDESNLRSIMLEGDFSNYFTFYVPEKLEIEALEIFTPDVMHEMISFAKAYSIEFIDDKIYVYYGRQVTKLHTLEDMYRLAQMMHDRMTNFLSKKPDQWFYTREQIKSPQA
ncbi:MAG: hypothetical protein K0S38_300 [Candidatus Paceibacter sp.]|jgi:hypothetical protein|nr:hypothetical protein [Candidatus Paceibacter sp.]